MSYADFLNRKRIADPMTGVADVPALPAFMFPHQRDIASWALRRGRAAVFAGTGLGKTLIELIWGNAVAAFTGKPVLIFAPLAVATQHIREAGKFGLTARIVTEQSEVGAGVNITNYQKMGHFDLSVFGGIVLDESSILKSTDGHYRTRLIEECATIPFRLAATATPSPNDFMELGNHAEFLGVMSYTDMLATFFTHDGGDTQKWRLKGHAENEFWKWMASWAVMLRKPSDLGYPDEGYDLPALVQTQHIVGVDYAPSLDTGLLFPMEARSLAERIAARRDTVEERVRLATALVNGSHRDNLSACQVEKNAPPTCESIASAILTNGSEAKHSKTPSTSDAEPNTLRTPNTENVSKHRSGQEDRRKSDGLNCSGTTTGSPQTNTQKCSASKMEFAPSAEGTIHSDASPSITATKPEKSEDFSAPPATTVSAGSETIQTASLGQSNTSGKRAGAEPWLIWCQLNSEQDALEKAFAGRCLSVRGSDDEADKEAAIVAWLRGDKPIMISKPSIMGFGLNFQHCNNMLFVGLNDSFEQVYQAIRRCWRFGQTKPVNVHFIAAETEGAVVANIRRKEADAERMAAAMVMHTASISSEVIRGAVRDRPDYFPQVDVHLPTFLTEEAA
jgi:hypothetical protein